MGDGNLHRHSDLPCLLAGNLGGTFKTGRHLEYTLDTPMANLLLTILDGGGVRLDKLGDSTGRLLEPLSLFLEQLDRFHTPRTAGTLLATT